VQGIAYSYLCIISLLYPKQLPERSPVHYQDYKVHSVIEDIRNWVERKLLALRMFQLWLGVH
jgi:hypothetical protein